MMKNNYAGFFLRFLGHLIDSLIGITIFLFMISTVFSSPSLPETLNSILFVFICFMYLGIIMPILYSFFVSKFGGTPGKLLVGIKVTREDGKPLSFQRSLFRTFVGVPVSSLFLGLGYFYIFKDEKRRGWHDLVTGSVVVKSVYGNVFVGILSLILLMIVNLGVTKNIITSIVANQGVYSQIINDVKDEFEQSIEEPKIENESPTPVEQNSPTQKGIEV
jgi:uncharacterized RDD family membrane protein YckC